MIEEVKPQVDRHMQGHTSPGPQHLCIDKEFIRLRGHQSASDEAMQMRCNNGDTFKGPSSSS